MHQQQELTALQRAITIVVAFASRPKAFKVNTKADSPATVAYVDAHVPRGRRQGKFYRRIREIQSPYRVHRRLNRALRGMRVGGAAALHARVGMPPRDAAFATFLRTNFAANVLAFGITSGCRPLRRNARQMDASSTSASSGKIDMVVQCRQRQYGISRRVQQMPLQCFRHCFCTGALPAPRAINGYYRGNCRHLYLKQAYR